MTTEMNRVLSLVCDYCDRADVIVTLEKYWFLGTIEVIADSIGAKLYRDELEELVDFLMKRY